jgi:hypothetical protein
MTPEQLAQAIAAKIHLRFPGVFNTSRISDGWIKILLPHKLDGGPDWNNGLGCVWMVSCHDDARVQQVMKWAGKKTYAAYGDRAGRMLVMVGQLLREAARDTEFIHICPEHGHGEEDV